MSKKSQPVADSTVEAAGDDTVLGGTAPDHVANCEALGLDPEKVQPDDPVLTGVARDERHDSIDPAWGTLTEEAQALRREQAEAAVAG